MKHPFPNPHRHPLNIDVGEYSLPETHCLTRDWLKRESDDGTKTVKQIFDRESFEMMGIGRWRERILGSPREIMHTLKPVVSKGAVNTTFGPVLK